MHKTCTMSVLFGKPLRNFWSPRKLICYKKNNNAMLVTSLYCRFQISGRSTVMILAAWSTALMILNTGFSEPTKVIHLLYKQLYGNYRDSHKQCWGSRSSGLACFGPPGSGSISERYASGSFPFLIKVLSGQKKCLKKRF